MAQADGVVANGTGAAVRADLNDQLAAVFTNHSGSSEPATTYAYQWWADTTANVLKIRNSANNAWITLRELDGTLLMEDGSASSPGLAFADDVNTGIFSPAADQIGFATGGAERLLITSSEVAINDPSNDVDFRVESNGQTHMLFVDAGNDRIGITENSPSSLLSLGTSLSDFKLKLYDGGDANDYGFGVQSGVLHYHSGGAHVFEKGGSEVARIDSSGRLLVGTSADKSISSDANALVQIFTSSAGKLLIGRSDASVVADDFLGIIDFHTFDGGSQRGARIAAVADGDHASGDVPSRIEFSTCADGSSSLTERVRIDSSGNVGIGSNAPLGRLEVSDDAQSDVTAGDLIVDTTGLSADVIVGRLSGRSNDNTTFRVRDRVDNTLLSSSTSTPLVVGHSTGEAMRVDNSRRLLMGTTSNIAPDGFASRIQTAGTNHEGGSLTIRRDQNSGSGPALLLTKSRSTSVGGNTAVADDDNIGSIRFYAADGTDANSYCANIAAAIDGTPGGNDVPGRLEFYTTADGASSATERMRITSSGDSELLLGTTSGSNSSNIGVKLRGGGASTVDVVINAASNINLNHVYNINATNNGYRFYIQANGGVVNHSGNNVNLSDEREKKNIVDMDSAWSDLKQWVLREFHFNDEDDSDPKHYGVIAQQIETVSPEVISDFQKNETTTRKGVKELQMMWMAIKALQEAQARIETLETKVAALEAG